MSRASEELLAQLHGMVGQALLEGLRSEDEMVRNYAIKDAMRFLKDNNITATLNSSPQLRDIKSELPTAEELERLMTLTPNTHLP